MKLKPVAEQVVVVVGASSGIGRRTAMRFAERGARLVVAARDEEGLTSLVDDIQRIGRQAEAVVADVTKPEDMTALAYNAAGGHGCISVVSNVAPKLCAEMQGLSLKGDYAGALKVQDRLVPLHDAVFMEPGLAGAKAGLNLLGRMNEEVRLPLLGDAGEVRRRVLHADDVLELIEPRHRGVRHIDHGARRDVVDQDRDADSVVHGLEVLVEPFLRRLVVVGRDHEQRVGAGFLGVPGEVDRLGRVVGTGAGDHGDTALRLGDRPFHNLLVLVMAERRALAGGADRHQALRALGDLPGDMLAHRRLVGRAVLERRHQRGEGASERAMRSHGVFPSGFAQRAVPRRSRSDALAAGRGGCKGFAASERRRAFSRLPRTGLTIPQPLRPDTAS